MEASITLVDQERRLMVLQDDSAAMAVYTSLAESDWKPGQRVIVKGDGIYPGVEAFPMFPDEPSSRDFLDSFEEPSNNGTFFLARLRGLLHPPVTGQYVFWIAADDAGELFLSPNAVPDSLRKIAGNSLGNSTRPLEWNRYPSQQSQPITLHAGAAYYVEALHVQGTGSNSLAVAWQGPGLERSVIEGRYLTPWNTALPAQGLLREYWTNFFVRDFEALHPRHPDEPFARIHALQLVEAGSAEMPVPLPIQPGTSLDAVPNLSWVELEGDVAFAAGTAAKSQLELKLENSVLAVHILNGGLSIGQLAHSRVRVRGVLEHSHDPADKLSSAVLWVPDGRQVTRLDSVVDSAEIASGFSICDIAPSNPEMRWGRRVRVRGRIINQATNGFVVIKGNDNYQAFCSADGTNWVSLGKPVEIGMSNSVLSGLALASHIVADPATASFEHLQGLGTNWLGADIGRPGHPGSFDIHNGTLNLQGSGRGIVMRTDQQYYLYQTQQDEAGISVQLTGLSEQFNHAQAGLMFRDSLDRRSCYAAVLFAPVSGAVFQYRATFGGNSSGVDASPENQSFKWLKLVKRPSLLQVQGTPDLNFDTNELLDVAGMITWQNGIPSLMDASFQAAPKDIPSPQPVITNSQPALSIAEFVARAQHPLEPYLYHGLQATKLRGIVTYCGDFLGSNVVCIQQGDLGGLQMRWPDARIKPAFEVGQLVEVNGNAQVRRFPVVLDPSSIRITGWGTLPEPVPYSSALIENDSSQSLWVEATGVMRSEPTNGLFSLMTPDGLLSVWVGQRFDDDDKDYLDALVRVRGVLSLDSARHPCLLAPSYEFVEMQERPPVDPFEVPGFSIAELSAQSAKSKLSRQMKTVGVVTCILPGGIYLQDDTGGLFVQTTEPATVHPGDRVEVVGFPEHESDPLTLSRALIRRLETVPLPNPVRVSGDASIKKQFAGMLVGLTATVLEQRDTRAAQLLTLQMGTRIFEAAREADEYGKLPPISAGSRVAITGVCQLDRSVTDFGMPESGSALPATSLKIWLPAAADVVVLERPPWWTLKRVAWLGAIFAFGFAGTLAWVRMLRRSVTLKTRELQSTMQRLEKEKLTSAVLAERDRLAGEIHDSLEQGLTAIMLQLDAANKHADQSPDARRFVSLARNMAEFSRSEVQHAVWDMQSPLLANADLDTALKFVAGQICSGSPEIKVEIVGRPAHPLSSSCEHHLLRIAQEAITNAVKHAQARNIQVTLDYSGTQLKLAVSDDGRGFDPAAVKHLDQNGHFGLHGIRARAKKIEARLEITSQPGMGTVITVQMKWTERPASAVADESGPL